jgi:large subunit ribosomal protein L24
MKAKFSKTWIASKQARKQRKYRVNAPLHIKHKMLAANLSKELRKKYGKRSMKTRTDDKVKIMSGEFKKKEGKILKIDLKRLKVYIEGIQRTKKDGSKINVPIDPSNLQIVEIKEDKKRFKMKKESEEKK